MAKKIRIAINGFGRIGRTTFKAALEHEQEVEVVALNDLGSAENMAYLLKYDTNYGTFSREIGFGSNFVSVDGKKFILYAEKDPKKLPWKKLNVDVVLECTGRFTNKEDAVMHITAGAKQVIISAPAKSGSPVGTFVLGVNAHASQGWKQGKGTEVISNASCTTNCISPVMAVLESAFGVKKAMMTTVHSYTADQNLVDGPHKDFRRGRSAGANIVPTSTGAAIATTETIPSLKGKFDGIAIRVPSTTGSLSDITAVLKKKVTVESVNAAFKKAAKNPLFKGILAVSEEEIVSKDIVGRPESAIVDLPLTMVVGDDMVKVFAWYDNEWAYSLRLIEEAILVGRSVTSYAR